ncbi:hypothetical protein MMPV_001398 [Pyropia vietnamensis]
MTKTLPEFALLSSSRLAHAWLTPPAPSAGKGGASGGGGNSREADHVPTPILTPAGLAGAIAWERVVNLVPSSATSQDNDGGGPAAGASEVGYGFAGPTLHALSLIAVPVHPAAPASSDGSPRQPLTPDEADADLVCLSLIADIERDWSPLVTGGRFFLSPSFRGVFHARTQELLTVSSCAATVRAKVGCEGSTAGTGAGSCGQDGSATAGGVPNSSSGADSGSATISGEVINIEYYKPNLSGDGGGMGILTSVLRRPAGGDGPGGGGGGNGGRPEITLLARMSAYCTRVNGSGSGSAWAAAAAAAGGQVLDSLAVAGRMWSGSYGCGYAPSPASGGVGSAAAISATAGCNGGGGSGGGTGAAVPLVMALSPCGAAGSFRLRSRAVAALAPPRVQRPLADISRPSSDSSTWASWASWGWGPAAADAAAAAAADGGGAPAVALRVAIAAAAAAAVADSSAGSGRGGKDAPVAGIGS